MERPLREPGTGKGRRSRPLQALPQPREPAKPPDRGRGKQESGEQQARLGCWLGSPPSHEARDRARVFPRRPTGAAQLSGGHGSRCGGLNGCSRRTRGCRSRRRRWPQPRSRRSAAGGTKRRWRRFRPWRRRRLETLDGWRPERARQVWLTSLVRYVTTCDRGMKVRSEEHPDGNRS